MISDLNIRATESPENSSAQDKDHSRRVGSFEYWVGKRPHKMDTQKRGAWPCVLAVSSHWLLRHAVSYNNAVVRQVVVAVMLTRKKRKETKACAKDLSLHGSRYKQKRGRETERWPWREIIITRLQPKT